MEGFCEMHSQRDSPPSYYHYIDGCMRGDCLLDCGEMGGFECEMNRFENHAILSKTCKKCVKWVVIFNEKSHTQMAKI